MKIQIDGQEIFEIDETQQKVLSCFIRRDQLLSHIKESVKWNIESLCLSSVSNLKKEWLPHLFKRYTSIPTGDEELLNLIFSQPDCKSKEQKDFESTAQADASFKEE